MTGVDRAVAAAPAVSALRLRVARDVLRAGGVVAYPTEGVFGIGCDPRNHHAVARVIAIKGRAAGKGLILIGSCEDQVMRYAFALDAQQMCAVRSAWPGPVSWVLPARPDVDALVTGGRDTVVVRVTAHPVAAALCRAFGGAIVSTSANRSGRPPAVSAIAVRRALGDAVDLVVPGRTGGARGPSAIRDARSGRVLRGSGS